MKRWYTFYYHYNQRVSVHYCTPELVERIRAVARVRQWDLVIVEN